MQVVVFLFGTLLFLPPLAGMAGEIHVEKLGQYDPRELSGEEKEWFQAFQEGTFYARGWKDITAQILEKAPLEVRDELQHTLEALGMKIGCEWSKSNEMRKIDNDMLEQWGSLLEQTAEQEPHLIPQVVASIKQKVIRLLE